VLSTNHAPGMDGVERPVAQFAATCEENFYQSVERAVDELMRAVERSGICRRAVASNS